MKYTIELNEQDLKEVLAKRIGVEETDIEIKAFKEYEGQGPTEQEVLHTKAIIIAEPDIERMYR